MYYQIIIKNYHSLTSLLYFFQFFPEFKTKISQYIKNKQCFCNIIINIINIYFTAHVVLTKMFTNILLSFTGYLTTDKWPSLRLGINIVRMNILSKYMYVISSKNGLNL